MPPRPRPSFRRSPHLKGQQQAATTADEGRHTLTTLAVTISLLSLLAAIATAVLGFMGYFGDREFVGFFVRAADSTQDSSDYEFRSVTDKHVILELHGEPLEPIPPNTNFSKLRAAPAISRTEFLQVLLHMQLHPSAASTGTWKVELGALATTLVSYLEKHTRSFDPKVGYSCRVLMPIRLRIRYSALGKAHERILEYATDLEASFSPTGTGAFGYGDPTFVRSHDKESEGSFASPQFVCQPFADLAR